MRKLTLLTIILMVAFSMESIGAYVSSGNGYWIRSGTWGGTWNSPVIEIENKAAFQKNMKIQQGHEVSTDSIITFSNNNFHLEVWGTLNLGGVVTNNNIIITVYAGGKINIKNDLDLNNSLTLNIVETGQLIIGGILDLKNNASIVVNGELSAITIDGNKNNNLTGTGIVYLNEEPDGINLDNFTGIIVYGNTNFSVRAPYALNGVDYSDPSIRVYLDWQFKSDSINPDFVEFIGFQIFKNNNPNIPAYTSELIVNSTHTTGVKLTTTSLADFFYWDYANLAPGDVPRYIIRAAYTLTGDPTKVVYSTVSIFDFANFRPLPVELLSFTAKANGNAVVLTWVTASETNNMGFEIQRLGQGNWQALGFIDGHYNHNGILTYHFTDAAPKSGVNYYRLKQMDYDGRFEYLGPVAAQLSLMATAEMKVFKNQNLLQVFLPVNQEGTLEVFDLQGRLVLSQAAMDQANLSLEKGTYILRFIYGAEVLVNKIMH